MIRFLYVRDLKGNCVKTYAFRSYRVGKRIGDIDMMAKEEHMLVVSVGLNPQDHIDKLSSKKLAKEKVLEKLEHFTIHHDSFPDQELDETIAHDFPGVKIMKYHHEFRKFRDKIIAHNRLMQELSSRKKEIMFPSKTVLISNNL
jgi:hypothetical protein